MSITSRNIFIFLSKIIFILVLGILVCCSDRNESLRENDLTVNFSFNIKDNIDVKTRFDSAYITTNPYDVDFYICMMLDKDNETKKNFGTYIVPSGYEGRLGAKDTGDALMWQDLTSPHTFYSWTIPWEEDYYNGNINTEDVPVKFHNSSEESGFKMNHNNNILEKFIGAKSGPYSYANNGKYVDLTFFHLVSKIHVNSLSLIASDGSIQKHLKADVTFINMPTYATLHITPDEGRPWVEPGDKDPDNGITYFIDNTATETDEFYICPEVDFRDIDFQVKINTEGYESYKTYYGTFADVKFERIPGENHDIGDETDDYVLHAGEVMHLNIVLIPGVGPGLSVIIEKWSTENPKESKYYSYNGVYSEAEMQQIIDAFLNQKLVDGKVTTEGLNELFETYGQEIDGVKYFFLYEDIFFAGTNYPAGFPVWKDYILNGLGHTLEINMNAFSHVFGANQPYFNIGPVRDIYLTGTYGDKSYTIYIDENGYVCTYDPETNSYVNSGNKLEPLEDGKYSYNIDAQTGKVLSATYYNNNTGLNT